MRVEIEEFESFLLSLKTKGLACATCNRIRSLLQAMFSVAIKKRLFNGIVKSNPFVCIERMPEDRKEIVYWEKDEIERFRQAHEKGHYWPSWFTLLNRGLRIGEAVALQRDQVDTIRHHLIIKSTWVETSNSVQDRTKSTRSAKNHGVRRLGIPEELREVIYPILPATGFIFTKPDGTMLTPNYMRKLLPSVCDQAGVKRLNPHGFRHTFSAHYLMDDGNMHDLQQELGHSSMTTTESYYAHFSDEHIHRRTSVAVLGCRGNVITGDFQRKKA